MAYIFVLIDPKMKTFYAPVIRFLLHIVKGSLFSHDRNDKSAQKGFLLYSSLGFAGKILTLPLKRRFYYWIVFLLLIYNMRCMYMECFHSMKIIGVSTVLCGRNKKLLLAWIKISVDVNVMGIFFVRK